ncbi:MAG: ABC transporter ATP-binding protein [Arenicellales bacterium]
MSIEFRQVVKRVDSDTHIYETDLRLEQGGFNVLLGTTLSGKTTLLRLMAGLEAPSSGEIWFEGKNVTGVPVQKRSVSMVYQQFINYPNFNVFSNIASPLKVARVSSAEIKKKVEKIAGLLKLDNLLGRYPSELSGGQQQRIAIARALVKDSKLVLLDEPLANLDYKLREELRDEMPKLFADTGSTVVYSTTEPMEALMLGGHTATLHQGRVSQYGVTSEGYRLPDNLTSARVFSDPPINTAEVRKQGGRFFLNQKVSWLAPRSLRGLQDNIYTMAIRPHHLLLNADKSGSIRIDAKVKIAELSGSESVIHVDVDGNDWVSECHGIHPFDSGDHTEIYMQVDRCLYFDQQQQLIRG